MTTTPPRIYNWLDGATAENGKELLGAGLIASGWAAAIEEEMNQLPQTHHPARFCASERAPG